MKQQQQPQLTQAQRQLFRLAILRVLDRNPTGQMFGPFSISMLVQEYGFTPTSEDVQTELHYLEGEPLQFVKRLDKAGFSPEIKCWQITTKGMNFLAEQTGGN